MLYVEVPDEELVERLSGRLICRECQVPFHRTANPFRTCPHGRCKGEHLYQRADDAPETVRARLVTFHRQTAPVIDYYGLIKLLVTVPGHGPVDDVKRATLEAVRRLGDAAEALRIIATICQDEPCLKLPSSAGSIPKEQFKAQIPTLRTELLETQRQLTSARFPVIVVFAGVDGAGKGETVNLLNEWMDPRWIVTRAYGEPSDEESERPEYWRYWRDLPPKAASACS